MLALHSEKILTVAIGLGNRHPSAREWRSRVKYFVWILLLCAPASAVSCPAGQPKEETTLVAIEETWAHALDQHDANALACTLADEFEDADIDGKVNDRRATLA